MDSLAHDQPSEEVVILVSNLRKYRRQLQNVNLPVCITADVLRKVELTVSQLKSLNSGASADTQMVANEIAIAEEVSRDVMLHLNIRNLYYASPHHMNEFARKVKASLLQETKGILEASKLHKKQKQMLQRAILAAIRGDGDEDANVPDLEAQIARGLLTGLGRNELERQCAANKCGRRLSQLLNKVSYKRLSKLFSPRVKIGSIKQPSGLMRRGRKKVLARDPVPTPTEFETNQSYIPLEPVDGFETASHEFRVAKYIPSNNNRNGVGGFLVLLKHRLKISRLPEDQCADILAKAREQLDYVNWFPPRDVNEIFVVGLLAGEVRATMFQRCKTDSQKLRLTEILEYVDLQGLRVGKDWVWDGSGRLVASKDPKLDNVMNRVAAAEPIVEKNVSIHNVSSLISDGDEISHNCTEQTDAETQTTTRSAISNVLSAMASFLPSNW